MRHKYKLKHRKRISPKLVAAHPSNRKGIGPNGQRCGELLGKHLLGHFNPEEADHDCVAVECAPGSDSFTKFNQDHARGDSSLADVRGHIQFGTLGHTHVNQVLRNVLCGATCSLDICSKVLDRDGRLSLDLVRSQDAELASCCEVGLEWEVLSHMMDIEEPNAADLISRALNMKNSSCMQSHEMEARACLLRCCYCTSSTASV
jgi:hypothetical protein